MQFPFMNRWHPELALRYLPMVRSIKNNGCQTIVEIGSGGLGITPYLKSAVIGVDVSFSPPIYPKLIPVMGSGMCLPLKSSVADVVVCSDMLEHVSQEERSTVINELFRISNKLVIIALPMGKLAHQEDLLLDNEYQQVHGYRHPFLREQTEYGLPEIEDIKKLLPPHQHLEIIGNTNLDIRLWMMRGWISKNPMINLFHRKILLIFLPLLKLFANKPPYYRQIFVIHKNSD